MVAEASSSSIVKVVEENTWGLCWRGLIEEWRHSIERNLMSHLYSYQLYLVHHDLYRAQQGAQSPSAYLLPKNPSFHCYHHHLSW